MSEFTDLITISQMTPGPIAVNSATFVGLKVAGIAGAAAATAGCVLPSCILVTVIARFYLKYRSMTLLQGILESLRPAVVALIASAGLSIMTTALWGEGKPDPAATDWSMAVIFLICVVLLKKCRMNPVTVMVLAGGMNVVWSALTGMVS